MTNIEELIMDTFNKVSAVEEHLEGIEQSQREEEARIQHKYDLLKAPVYKKRNEIVSIVPSFWRMALRNHSAFVNLVSEEDEVLLDALKSIEVERDENDFRVFRIILNFGQNTEFENTQIIKEMRSNPDGSILVTDTPIQWKSTTGEKRKREASFMDLFQDDSEDAIEIANGISDDEDYEDFEDGDEEEDLEEDNDE